MFEVDVLDGLLRISGEMFEVAVLDGLLRISGNKPRLDIKLSFADGRRVRYHPKAILIWFHEQLPSQAMQARYNRAAKLQKRGYRRH